MIARQTLNVYIQYLKNLPRLRGYSLVYTRQVRLFCTVQGWGQFQVTQISISIISYVVEAIHCHTGHTQ